MTSHRCEAMVLVKQYTSEFPGSKQKYSRERYVACGALGAELHHKLTRARGGLILDAVGESYHHLWLCRVHHGVAHDQGAAFANGLLIDGYVTTENGQPVYVGSDEYLSQKYGATHEPEPLSGGAVS